MVPDSPRLQVAAETVSASMGSLDPGDVFWGPSEQQSSQQPSSSPAQQGSRRSLDDSSVFNGTGGGQGVNQISLASSWLPLSFESLGASTAGQTATQAPQRPSVFNPTPWDPSSSSVVGISRFDGNGLMSGSWEDRSCSSRSMMATGRMLLQSQSMPGYNNRNSSFDIISQQRSSYNSPGNDHNRQPESPKDADRKATTRRPHNDSSSPLSRRLSRASQHSSVSDEEDHHHHVNKKRGDKPKKALPEPPGHGLGDIDPAVLDALPQEDWKTLTSAGVRLAGRSLEELQAKALSIKNRRRESAARSRQHRAQHAVELEEENRQLKSENEKLKMMLGVIQQGWPPAMPPF